MFDKLDENINKYKTKIDVLKNDANKIRNKLLEDRYSFLIEGKNIFKLDEIKKGSAFGTDSGFFNSYITGLDFVYVKTAGSFLKYDKKLIDYKRLKITKELFLSEKQLQKDEVNKFASIKRIASELDKTIEGINKFNPEFVFIDGSILPQPIDRPSNTSNIIKDYMEMLEKFVKVYDLCKDNDINLIGTIEDSRANTFLKKINEIKNINDVVFLNYVLKKGEGISFIKLLEEETVIKNDLKSFGNFDFFASYLKINEDYPLRIETTSKKFKDVRNFTYFISNFYKEYAYSSVIIDADKQAKLDLSEIKQIKDYIQKRFISLGLKPFRRNRRV